LHCFDRARPGAVIALLLANGLDPFYAQFHGPTGDNLTLAAKAVWDCRADLVEILLKHTPAAVHVRSPVWGKSLVHFAWNSNLDPHGECPHKQCNPVINGVLYAYGAKPGVTSGFGWTPALCAAGRRGVASAMLRHADDFVQALAMAFHPRSEAGLKVFTRDGFGVLILPHLGLGPAGVASEASQLAYPHFPSKPPEGWLQGEVAATDPTLPT
jgi:hypothetical protein